MSALAEWEEFPVCQDCLSAAAGYAPMEYGIPDMGLPLSKLFMFDIEPGDDSEGFFSWSRCEGCGNLAGMRYSVLIRERPEFYNA